MSNRTPRLHRILTLAATRKGYFFRTVFYGILFQEVDDNGNGVGSPQITFDGGYDLMDEGLDHID